MKNHLECYWQLTSYFHSFYRYSFTISLNENSDLFCKVHTMTMHFKYLSSEHSLFLLQLKKLSFNEVFSKCVYL